MNQNKLRGISRTAIRFRVLVAILAASAWGCSSSPTDGGKPKAKYDLQVILEKNLNDGRDYLWTRFLREREGIVGGMVVVDGDTIPTLPLSGEGSKSYGIGHWTTGRAIPIAAVDTSEGFVYRDSLVLPAAFFITNVIPPSRLWQGGTVTIEWSPSLGITGYAISVKPRTTGSGAEGLSDRIDLGEYSYTFNGEAFQNDFGVTVADAYFIQVLAYTPNLLSRGDATYKSPPLDTPSPIQKESISGVLCALTVSARDSIVVPQGQ
ncbi:MAG: hypothetical protein AB1792_06450 [Candidatus Zixiibacteriota bacterium]